MRENLHSVVGIKLKTSRDLVRLAASSAASGQSIFILRIKSENRIIYGVLAVFRDFFKLYGVPLLYYFIDEAGEIPENANYASIKVDGKTEDIKFGQGAEAGYLSIPIINLGSPPEFLDLNKLI